MSGMTTRQHLPNRRPSQTVDLDFGGKRYSVGFGFYPDGRLAEAFVSGAKTGSQLDAQLNDAAILISLMLQHDIKPRDIAKSMSRVRVGEAASLIGALADLLTVEAGAG